MNGKARRQRRRPPGGVRPTASGRPGAGRRTPGPQDQAISGRRLQVSYRPSPIRTSKSAGGAGSQDADPTRDFGGYRGIAADGDRAIRKTTALQPGAVRRPAAPSRNRRTNNQHRRHPLPPRPQAPSPLLRPRAGTIASIVPHRIDPPWQPYPRATDSALAQAGITARITRSTAQGGPGNGSHRPGELGQDGASRSSPSPQPSLHLPGIGAGKSLIHFAFAVPYWAFGSVALAQDARTFVPSGAKVYAPAQVEPQGRSGRKPGARTLAARIGAGKRSQPHALRQNPRARRALIANTGFGFGQVTVAYRRTAPNGSNEFEERGAHASLPRSTGEPPDPGFQLTAIETGREQGEDRREPGRDGHGRAFVLQLQRRGGGRPTGSPPRRPRTTRADPTRHVRTHQPQVPRPSARATETEPTKINRSRAEHQDDPPGRCQARKREGTRRPRRRGRASPGRTPTSAEEFKPTTPTGATPSRAPRTPRVPRPRSSARPTTGPAVQLQGQGQGRDQTTGRAPDDARTATAATSTTSRAGSEARGYAAHPRRGAKTPTRSGTPRARQSSKSEAVGPVGESVTFGQQAVFRTRIARRRTRSGSARAFSAPAARAGAVRARPDSAIAQAKKQSRERPGRHPAGASPPGPLPIRRSREAGRQRRGGPAVKAIFQDRQRYVDGQTIRKGDQRDFAQRRARRLRRRWKGPAGRPEGHRRETADPNGRAIAPTQGQANDPPDLRQRPRRNRPAVQHQVTTDTPALTAGLRSAWSSPGGRGRPSARGQALCPRSRPPHDFAAGDLRTPAVAALPVPDRITVQVLPAGPGPGLPKKAMIAGTPSRGEARERRLVSRRTHPEIGPDGAGIR